MIRKELLKIKSKRKVVKPKEFTYHEAYEIALDNSSAIMISVVTRDRYKVECIDKKERIKFFGPAIKNWQSCVFILADELVGKWNIEKDGIVITEVVTE